ncbi:hypothetical protein AGMMS49579_00770 [Spirochaetia bacterium]|nr:hypothetical protein AGMMS49579_00120 [Spirochaetia bacterium]GHV49362.1 hypothetical protein AGMMS49579_00770 [Spirochaetia bacterium]
MEATESVLSEDEECLIGKVEAWLAEKNPGEIQAMRDRIRCLRGLGEAVFRYPSVRESHVLRGEARDGDKLIESICAFSGSSRLLHLPTKVVAARSFLVAKFHAFSMLALLVGENTEYYKPLRRILFSVISILITAEVYFSCLGDSAFPGNLKLKIANDLVSLWDSGTDSRAIRHLPTLEALWTARESAPPSFGTMDGNSELLRITIDMGDDWQDFLVEESTSDEATWALEEFLFSLSYEELQEVRSRLIRFGIPAVNYDEIRSYLGSKSFYTMVKGGDIKDIYNFYIDRRDAAFFRKRTGAPGPVHTLEELYLKYRIILEQG